MTDPSRLEDDGASARVSVWSSDARVPHDTWAQYALIVAHGRISFYVNGRLVRTFGGDQPLNEHLPIGCAASRR